MIQKLLRSVMIISVVLASGLGTLTLQAHAASIDPSSQACEALGAASGGGGCKDPSGPDVNNTLKTAINLFSIVVGFAALVMIIVGGLKYILSQGESSNVNSAKNTILYAIIGLVVVVFAQVIVKFVLGKTTNPCKAPTSLQADGTCK